RKKISACKCGYFHDHLLENWGARRAFLRPYFLRSLARGSRVRRPSFLSAGRVSGSACKSARALPRLMAPAWPAYPPAATLTTTSYLPSAATTVSGVLTTYWLVPIGK